MKTKIQKKPINAILFTTGILLILISYQKLYLKKHEQNSGKSRLGLIESFQNKVRLKNFDHFEWKNLLNGQYPVSANDKIFSHDKSNAVIKLNIGHQIILNENSLIKLKDSQSIKLNKGNISLKLVPQSLPLTLFLGEKQIKIKATTLSHITITNFGNNNSHVLLTKGSVELIDQSRRFDLSENEELTLNNSNDTFNRYVLKSPNNETLFTKFNTAQVNFRFDQLDSNKEINLSKTVSFEDSTNIKYPFKAKLAPGLYFWKIGNTDPAMFKVIKTIAPPKVISPQSGEKVMTYTETGELKINSKNKSSDQIIQIYDLNSVLISQIKSKSHLNTIKKLMPGKYYFQIKASGNFIQSNWTKKFYFEIRKLAFNQDMPLVIELKKPNQRIKFTWEKKAKELSLFEISRDSSFKDIVISKRIRSKNFTHITFPKLGKYYWRASKVNKNGSKTIQRPLQIIIKPTPPPTKPKMLPNLDLKIKRTLIKRIKNNHFNSFHFLVNKIINLIFPSALARESLKNSSVAKVKEAVEISFPKIDNAKSYEIEIYLDKELKQKIKSIQILTNTFKWLPSKTGRFYWRLRYNDYWDRTSEFSDSSKMEISFIKKTISNKKKATSKIPKVSPTLAQKIISPEQTQAKYQINFKIGPSSLNFSQKKSTNFSIKGQTYNSWGLGLKKALNNKIIHSLGINYLTQGGKVYDDLEFKLRHLDLSAHTKWYNLEPFIHFKHLSKFEENDSKVLKDGEILVISIGSAISRTFNIGKNQQVIPRMTLAALGSFDYSMSLNYQYHYQNDLYFLIHSAYYNSKSKLNSESINYQYFQLHTGFKYIF